MMVASGEGVEIHPQNSISEYSPILDHIGEAFCSFNIPNNVGKGQSGVHH